MIKLNDKMPNGRHKGQKVKSLIYEEPGYIVRVFKEKKYNFNTDVENELRLIKMID